MTIAKGIKTSCSVFVLLFIRCRETKVNGDEDESTVIYLRRDINLTL